MAGLAWAVDRGYHAALLEFEEETIHVNADPAECMAVIADFGSYPAWQDYFKHVEVLEEDKEGRGARVEYRIEWSLVRVRYVLAYQYKSRPLSVSWKLVEGDVKDIHGAWEFRKAKSGGTDACFRLHVDPGSLVPGFLARSMSRSMVQRSVAQLKERVEAGHGVAGRGKSRTK